MAHEVFSSNGFPYKKAKIKGGRIFIEKKKTVIV